MGKEYSVTEYTMSEIIAAVYDKIESSGLKEGILFIDEINCVSETLAPAILELLQFKRLAIQIYRMAGCLLLQETHQNIINLSESLI